ncbi:hypothetical protein RJ640_020666 [Escallonia rubra]|uniref:PsbP C-terminal domain-containing protein n=1 Tax=Escallonia rubra TaxID=112253 RepID=A0AA88UK62_9ASTE|nr:hypothetical protein RJ640_020666 [Escallonia rubra]
MAPVSSLLHSQSYIFTALSHRKGLQDASDDFSVYSDDVNKFQIMIPRDWQVGAGDGNGFKSVTAFYPKKASSSNVSVIITGLGADFTRLESFGKVDAFAENLSFCQNWSGLYYIEYSLQNPGESRRNLLSVLGMANNGWYNRLYTVTGQFVEEEAEDYSAKIRKVK